MTNNALRVGYPIRVTDTNSPLFNLVGWISDITGSAVTVHFGRIAPGGRQFGFHQIEPIND